MHYTVECGQCRQPLSRPLYKISNEVWANWFAELLHDVGVPTGYSVLPFVPFGSIFLTSRSSHICGERTIIKTDVFHGVKPSDVAFVAPNELQLSMLEEHPQGCCGPTVYESSRPCMVCSCGFRIGWTEEECTGPVHFVRLLLEKVHLVETILDSFPKLLEGEFDENILNLINSTRYAGKTRVEQLWEVYQQLLPEHSFDTDDGICWEYELDKVNIYEGTTEQITLETIPIKTYPIAIWSEHVRLALSTEMGILSCVHKHNGNA